MDAKSTQRRTRNIRFAGHRMKVYEPTDGQIAMIGIAVSGGGAAGSDAKRLLQILSALCVVPADWTRVEDGLIDGTLGLDDLQILLKQVFDYEWPALPKATKGQRAGRVAAAPDPTLDDDDDEDAEG